MRAVRYTSLRCERPHQVLKKEQGCKTGVLMMGKRRGEGFRMRERLPLISRGLVVLSVVCVLSILATLPLEYHKYSSVDWGGAFCWAPDCRGATGSRSHGVCRGFDHAGVEDLIYWLSLVFVGGGVFAGYRRTWLRIMYGFVGVWLIGFPVLGPLVHIFDAVIETLSAGIVAYAASIVGSILYGLIALLALIEVVLTRERRTARPNSLEQP